MLFILLKRDKRTHKRRQEISSFNLNLYAAEYNSKKNYPKTIRLIFKP